MFNSLRILVGVFMVAQKNNVQHQYILSYNQFKYITLLFNANLLYTKI